MAGGGLSNVVSQVGQMGQQGGMRPASQPTSQPASQPAAQPAYQSTSPNTGWNRPSYTTDPTRMSPTQNWWTNTQMGQAATDAGNLRDQAAFNATQKPIDRNTFNKTRSNLVSDESGNSVVTENYFDQAGYDQALAAQKANTYTPLTPQEALNQTLRNQIQGAMGNYGNMVNYANRTGISTADIQNAIGGNTDMYTYMNRPNYQQYSPNGQFNQPIYQSNYQNYNTGNPMAISQYGQGPDYYGMGLAQQMNTPFNPYTNSYQTPFSAQQAPTQPNYGPSRAIVSRSAGMRGTPNVVARRAEGGIASLMDNE